MKKFTFKGVLDGIRSSVAPQIKPDQDIVETLRPDYFQVAKTFRHGFPYQPTALAFDPIQRLLAIGTKNGSLRIIGRPGVDAQVRHELEAAVVQVEFLMNEGALITVTADDSLHLWNFRQKRADVVHSLKFQRERITVIHLPLRSKWLYVGSERGNVHFVNVETFTLSGYIINWNKAIEVTRPTHPGPIVHLSDNPADSSKLLIGFETGLMVLWDLKTKKPECRWQWGDSLKSIDWHFEGKQFTCSHNDGSLTTWNVKPSSKPANIIYPHAKNKTESCKPIQKVEWKSSKSGESYLIFSGGLTADTAGRVPSITIMHGKTTTVLEMDHNIVDFVTLCESPYNSDVQEPYAVAVLMQNDLVLIDLLSSGYPCFENPHPMDIHESPVSCVHYIADCPSDLIPAFYSVGSRSASKRTGYSENKWPIAGGEWSPTSCSYNEIILTGHTDGSVRFWDASAGSLQVLYKLKTAKVFEKARSKSPEGGDEDQFSVQLLSFCPESRKLAVAGISSYVVLFKFRKLESTFETTTLEIPIYSESLDEAAESSPEEAPSKPPGASDDSSALVKVRTGPQKKPPGFQACLACVTPSTNGEPPGQITALTINSSYGLLAYGLDNGIVIVDFIQKCVLLNISTADMYGSADPYQRAPRSPKRTTALSETSDGERCRSPSIDQGLEDEAEELEELCKLALSPVDVYSSQVSLNPADWLDDTTERAEEALVLIPAAAPEPEELAEPGEPPLQPTPPTVTASSEPATPAPVKGNGRRTSHSWRGLKKQLSRVDLRLKNTFNATPAKNKASTFYGSGGGEQPETDEVGNIGTVSTTATTTTTTTTGLPQIITETDGQEHRPDGGSTLSQAVDQSSASAAATRPTELKLFDRDGKPIKPPRSTKEHRKRTSLDKQGNLTAGSSRDARLLSVPNIKYSQRDPRHNRSNNQAFINLIKRLNKLDSSFSRSRSSSMSSLDNITTESIQCLTFGDSYTKKSDPSNFPTLWIGTSVGSVLTIMINLPPPGEPRTTQPVTVAPCGTIFRLKGGVLTMSFLDCNGALIPYAYEAWRDEGRDKQKTPTKNSSGLNRMSPALTGSSESVSSNPGGVGGSSVAQLQQQSQVSCDRQFVTIVSEKQVRVVALPSQNCVSKHVIPDADFMVKSEVISMKDSVCLACYISNGHINIYSLPSLKVLVDVDFLALSDLSFQTQKQGIVDPMLSIWGQQMFVNEDTDQIAKTFCFSNRGHGLFLNTPSEVQRFSVSTEFCQSLPEMMGELFQPHEMPEPPKQSFFIGLFGGGSRSIDREELFGESTSGKAPKLVAKLVPGPSAQLDALGNRASTAASEISRAHLLAVERGEKLSNLEDRTARMMNEAEQFSSNARELMMKNKDKRWYQL
ncbi:syntaxin-binding protein 5 isoform X1 [Rhopalosiphum padi]|uniref:syntaxin-binding protein 5 isoform X1 n=1 Tax=Rhopalosiphum padi TaxID=40932 RepID=UPI00298EC391|nr:syntaxin-binding protein 5 isoform X1 [Rhopalosiphum padi]